MSFGWVFLVALVFSRDQGGLPLAMGSPLYGTALATIAVGGQRNSWGQDEFAIGVGAVLWILTYAAAAVILFSATLATFDRCLGRVVETASSSLYWLEKKDPRHSQPDYDQWLADDAVT